jgi:hypothetical protein
MTLPLTAEMRQFLREISAKCKANGGRHVDGTQILRALVTALRKCEDQVDWDGVQDEEDLTQRLLKAFRKKR